MKEVPKLACHHGARVFPEAGKYLAAKCAHCGAPLDVERNRVGPRSFAEALAFRIGRLSAVPPHDRFTCPNQLVSSHHRVPSQPFRFELFAEPPVLTTRPNAMISGRSRT